MTGIALIVFIFIWGSIAVWLGRILSRKILTHLTGNTATGKLNKRSGLITFLTIAFVFLLPLADEIISYPSYYKMCEDGGKYQFAPGMDEKKVFGRKYRTKVEEEKLVRLFPTFQTLAPEDNSNFGVVIKSAKLKLVDDQTDETLLTTRTAKPLRSAFAIPWDGGRIPWLLHECSNMVGKNGEDSQKLIRSLQLHPSYRWD